MRGGLITSKAVLTFLAKSGIIIMLFTARSLSREWGEYGDFFPGSLLRGFAHSRRFARTVNTKIYGR